MKISSSVNSPIVSTISTSRTAGNSSTGSSAGGKSTVDLSATARHLSNLQNGNDDINMERVKELRDAIAAGQLKVDPSRVADSLIASVRELLK